MKPTPFLNFNGMSVIHHKCTALLLLSLAPVCAKDVVVEPAESHRSIDTKLSIDTIKKLKSESAEERASTVKQILETPGNYAPPVLYLLSSVLFDEGRKDEAMFWFYAGQIRGTFDANRCADVSARQAIPTLNQLFSSRINQYAFQDVAKLKATVEKALEWDVKTEYKYDHRWINLHGMGAFTGSGGSALSLPKEEWDRIAKETRDKYRASFDEALKRLEKKKP